MRNRPSIEISGIFPAECMNFAQKSGVDVSKFLHKADLSPEPGSLAARNVEINSLRALMRALWLEWPQPSLGFAAGLQIPPTALGHLGYAFMSAGTLGGALDVTQRYWGLIGRGIILERQTDADLVTLTYRIERGVESFLERWMIEAAIACSWRAISAVVPGFTEDLHVFLSASRPMEAIGPYGILPNLNFGSPLNQIAFPKALMREEPPLRSSYAFQQALKQCDSDIQTRSPDLHYTNRVKRILGRRALGFPTIEQAAASLGVSARTLRRQLTAEGSGYSRIIQEIRTLEAIQLLRNPSLRVSDVAAQLGYQDEANFCRAFRRWTDSSPTQIRQRFNAIPDNEGV